jgi:hypothetical protein
MSTQLEAFTDGTAAAKVAKNSSPTIKIVLTQMTNPFSFSSISDGNFSQHRH